MHYPPEFLVGVQLFNRHDYFHAHEAWEPLWRDSSEPEKSTLHTLIQLAVALVHAERSNLKGARKLLGTARQHAAAAEPSRLGVNLDQLLGEIANAIGPEIPVVTPDDPTGGSPLDLFKEKRAASLVPLGSLTESPMTARQARTIDAAGDTPSDLQPGPNHCLWRAIMISLVPSPSQWPDVDRWLADYTQGA